MWRYGFLWTCEYTDDFTDIKLCVKLYLNSLVHHPIMFGSSKSLAIIGHLRIFSEIFGKCSGTFVWPALIREILFLPLKHKIHIFSPPCNIFCMLFSVFLIVFFIAIISARICWYLAEKSAWVGNFTKLSIIFGMPVSVITRLSLTPASLVRHSNKATV